MKNFDFSKIKYIDTHSHLHDKTFDIDREEVIKRMNENCISTTTIGTDLIESERAKNLAEQNENIFYTVGLHPHDNLAEFNDLFMENRQVVLPDTEKIKEYFEKMKSLVGSEKCVAIGECGLDYFYLNKGEQNAIAPTIEQMKWMQKIIFQKHIDLALELNLPLMLHVRPSENPLLGRGQGEVDREDAYLDAIEILKTYYQPSLNEKCEDFASQREVATTVTEGIKSVRGNFHFFVSTKNVLEKILKDLPDFTISIPAVCTFTDEYDEMIKAIPLDKIHIETDSPYVIPKNKRKEAKRNEPNFVTDVFEKVCELKGFESPEEKENFRNILIENFKNLYLK